ncbi:hypothetical protein, partial [Escherichia coli]|uniref:hypothetical protein n=1 Tax=Escherichia coli TaxID=562 RepID=UPI001F1F3018
QDRRGQVQAATTAATGLAYDFFRFLRRPPLSQKGHIRRETEHQSHPVVHHTQMAWCDIQ